MTVQVAAEIVLGFKLVARNQCSAMGQYYPEDDWSITILAEDMNQLERKYVEEVFRSGIRTDRIDIFPVNLLKAPIAEEPKLFVWTEGTALNSKEVWAFRNRAENSEVYKAKAREKEDTKRRAEETAREEATQLQRQNDLKQYHRLKTMFEPEWDDWMGC